MMTSAEKTEQVAVKRAEASSSILQAEARLLRAIAHLDVCHTGWDEAQKHVELIRRWEARRLDAEAHVDRCKKAWREEQEHVRLDRQRADLLEASL